HVPLYAWRRRIDDGHQVDAFTAPALVQHPRQGHGGRGRDLHGAPVARAAHVHVEIGEILLERWGERLAHGQVKNPFALQLDVRYTVSRDPPPRSRPRPRPETAPGPLPLRGPWNSAPRSGAPAPRAPPGPGPPPPPGGVTVCRPRPTAPTPALPGPVPGRATPPSRAAGRRCPGPSACGD